MEQEFTKCVKCGAPKEDCEECPQCGIFYAKAESAFLRRKSQAEVQRKKEEEETARIAQEEADRIAQEEKEARIAKEKAARIAEEEEAARSVKEKKNELKKQKEKTKQEKFQEYKEQVHGKFLENQEHEQKPSIELDCQLCNSEKKMTQEVVNRFGDFIRLIGWLCAIPSILGIFFSILSLMAMFPEMIFPVILLYFSLTSGIVGWLLLSHKKVYLCNYCGYVVDRADGKADRYGF